MKLASPLKNRKPHSILPRETAPLSLVTLSLSSRRDSMRVRTNRRRMKRIRDRSFAPFREGKGEVNKANWPIEMSRILFNLLEVTRIPLNFFEIAVFENRVTHQRTHGQTKFLSPICDQGFRLALRGAFLALLLVRIGDGSRRFLFSIVVSILVSINIIAIVVITRCCRPWISLHYGSKRPKIPPNFWKLNGPIKKEDTSREVSISNI